MPGWVLFVRASSEHCKLADDQLIASMRRTAYYRARTGTGSRCYDAGATVRQVRKPLSTGMPSPGPVARPRFRWAHPRMCSEC